MGIINFQKLKQKVKGTRTVVSAGNAGSAGSAGNIKNKDAVKDAVNDVDEDSNKALKKSPLKHNLQHKNKVNAGKVNAGKANAGKVNANTRTGVSANARANVSRDSGLLESRYCYGCDQFCVDYPFTDKEQAWCVRPVLDNNGRKTPGYHMVRILPRHKVWQCPNLK